jgi:hypothetical protein
MTLEYKITSGIGTMGMSMPQSNIHSLMPEKKPNMKDIFEFKPVGQHGKNKINNVKMKAFNMYGYIMDNVKDNRERAIAISKIEEAVMWINKSISRSEANES